MAVTIFPTSPNSAITEANWQGVNNAANGRQSWRVTGFDLSVNSGLNLDVAAGTACIDGYYVNESATTTVALTDNATNRVWLQADGTIYDNTSDTPTAATDLFLGRVTTSGGSITEIEANEELDTAAGVEYEGGHRKSFCGIAQLAASQAATVCATLSVEPGVYWIYGRTSGSGASVLKNTTLEITCTTASNATAELAFIRHTEVAGANGGWGNSGTTVGFSHTSSQLTHFYTICGMASFAQAGEIQLELGTGANVSFNSGGYIVAKKIH